MDAKRFLENRNAIIDAKSGYPRFCDIVISNRCVLKCKMCTAWRCQGDSAEITYEQARNFVSALSEFIKFPLEINVMGGEPLLKDWCLDLCSFIHRCGFKSIISTNATLIDEDMAKKIADSNLDVLAISLESLRSNTHDFYRGVEGTLSKAMKAIEYIDKYCKGRLTVSILAIIMEKNLDDILELTEWVNRNGLFQNISFLALLENGLVPVRHNWFKSAAYAELWPQNISKTHKLIDELIKLRKKGYKIWNPISQLEAFKSYYVDPDKFMRETEYRMHDYILDLDEKGTIYLSGEPLGDVNSDDIKSLWFSKKANQLRQKIDEHGPGKRCCVINFVCAFPPDSDVKSIQTIPESKVHIEPMETRNKIVKPKFCVIEVSHRCMFRCKMCYYWKTKKNRHETSIKELSNFVLSLRHFVDGPFEMNISGGEPFLKKGILNFIEFVAQQGFRFSTVTNAYLINRRMARKIADSGLNFLSISLDSLDEGTHNYLRGLRDSYQRVIQAVAYFNEYRGKLKNLGIQTIITAKNLKGIPELAEWAKNNKLTVSFIAVMRPNMLPIDDTWYKKEPYKFLWPQDIGQVHAVIDKLIALKIAKYPIDTEIEQLERFKLYYQNPEEFVKSTPCNLGDDILHVNPAGEVYLCCEMESIGNIKDSDVHAIWTSERAERVREKIRVCKRNCAGMVNCYKEIE
ncbi:MAG: radical SAM protein [Candidatus Omnitrophica bacterium]|nr:radical SAM protein [Candidatus Omnitrophota bacterium]